MAIIGHLHGQILVVLLCISHLPPELAQPAAAGDSTTEADLLLAFKDSFTNGEELLPSWVNSTDVCAWHGVACNASGFVDRLELLDLGLEGTIPEPDGWVLPPKMTALALGNNRISGPIPAGWKLPATLNMLYFTSNQLSGSLSPNWNLGGGLLSVLLDNNNLSGPLPDWRLPPQLQFLSLNSNRLTGAIPASFTTSQSIQFMDLSNNSLSGPLPASFSFNTSQELYGLFVWGNNLTGTLPAWPGVSRAIVDISPGNDKLCGTVPSNPTYLRYDSESKQQSPIISLPSCIGTERPPPSSTVQSGGLSSTSLAVLVAVTGGALIGTATFCFWRWKRRRRMNQWNPDANHGSFVPDADILRGQEFVIDCEGSDVGTPKVSEYMGSSACSPAASLQCSSALLASDPLLASIVARLSSPNELECEASSEPQAARGRSSSSRLSLGVDAKAYVIPFQELQLHSQIGQGASTRVYLSTWREVKVAAKLLLFPEIDKESDAHAGHLLSITEHLQKEASLISALRHPNVLSFIGICTTPPVLVMEYCPRGSLYGILKSASTSQAMARQLDWTVRLKMAIGAAQGMLYLHTREPPILHRDLRSPNLLVTDSWTIKVTGFTLTKDSGKLGSSASSSDQLQNDKFVADPEVLAGEPYSFASDVFSFGLVLWGILTFQAPWKGTSDVWQISSATVKGSRPPLPDPSEVPGPMELRSGAKFEGLQAYMQLIQDCWAQNPADRPAFGDVVSRLRSMSERQTKKMSQR